MFNEDGQGPFKGRGRHNNPAGWRSNQTFSWVKMMGYMKWLMIELIDSPTTITIYWPLLRIFNYLHVFWWYLHFAGNIPMLEPDIATISQQFSWWIQIRSSQIALFEHRLAPNLMVYDQHSATIWCPFGIGYLMVSPIIRQPDLGIKPHIPMVSPCFESYITMCHSCMNVPHVPMVVDFQHQVSFFLWLYHDFISLSCP